MRRGSGISKRKACGRNDDDYYIRFDQIFNHAKMDVELNIKITTNNTKTNAIWGAK